MFPPSLPPGGSSGSQPFPEQGLPRRGWVPADGCGRRAKCGDLTPSSPAVVLPSAAQPQFSTEDDRLAAVNYPSQMAPHGIAHLEKPSLGTGVAASMHPHLYYYLQRYLESIISQMQRLRENKNAGSSRPFLFLKILFSQCWYTVRHYFSFMA